MPVSVKSENRHHILLTALSFFSLSTLAVPAQVTFFGVQKSAAYTQTADNTAPATPFEYTVFAFATTTSAGDADSFSAYDNDTISVVNSVGDPTSFGGSNYYTTKAAMDAGFTSGDSYTFTANGGTLDGNSDTLPVPLDYYPQQIYLTGTAVTDALDLNPHADFNFNIGYTTTGTGTNLATRITYNTYTNFSVFDPSTGNFIYSDYGVAAQGSFTAPSSLLETLTPGHTYIGQLTDFNTFASPTEGDFSGANNSDGFAQFTDFSIVVPEPSNGMLGCIASVVLLCLRFRSRRAQP